jgi:hypothetical protein
MGRGRVGLLVPLGLLALAAQLLAGCEDMGGVFREDGQLASVLRDGEVKLARVEF